MTGFIILLLSLSFGKVGTVGNNTWKEYSAEQKTDSIIGFVHCYRTAFSNKDAFAEADIAAVANMIDVALTKNGDEKIGNLVFEALKKAPNAKPDKYAEHSEGPYGFNDGMWWRGADDRSREAYVQGVFWCAETLPGKIVGGSEISVTAAVQKLNNWYLISDEDWKDPRSGKRADVPVLSAMRRLGMISKCHSEAGKKP